jgi:indolepyruvate ferredoxin oxidoreductase
MRLDDKYTLESGTVYLTGIQALVRLPLDQMRRDRRAGWNTGAFISGYEGSPLGGYDLALGRVRKLLDQHGVIFRPGLNEDLAATAVMGTQILEVLKERRVEGVVGYWYGKGPGVDRSGDVFRHANMAGAGKQGAAVVLAGDDHACKSSTIPHQSDFSLMNLGIPFLYPANAQEILDYGLLAAALSRWSGAWTGMKLITDVCDGGGTVQVDPERPRIELPEHFVKTTDARLVPPITLVLEAEVNSRRLQAALAFARVNRVNQWRGGGEGAWLGIATAGKSYLDVKQALRDLGLRSDQDLQAAGIRVAKFGMTFPLDGEFASEFGDGLEVVLVVEEKRSFLEMQLRDALYLARHRPLVIGKHDEAGVPLLPAHGELDPDRVARVLGSLLERKHAPRETLLRLESLSKLAERPKELILKRAQNFCSGCPHNRSTILLDGQVGGGGIGCHTMAMSISDRNRSFAYLTQMGGEGAPWIGMAPFVERKHVFQNIGDGTFFHSGVLALEACVAAGVNITYKILYNGHVAMTGGQDAVGALPIPQLTKKLEADGVKRTVILTEEPEKYEGAVLAANAEVRDRAELERTLREVEGISGVSVIIYDQECAAEKRRKRSRGKMADPVERLVINEAVCEGCGDCVKQSNCMSLTPVATEFGQKMRIHQSSCNKDYSCALGDCPSFVTVKIKEGTGLRRRKLPRLPAAEVAEPASRVRAGDGYRIFLPGIGGTGVVTINALLATAAWIDGLNVATLDQTGTAQKGGAVNSHLLISETPIELPAKVNAGNADLILGFDIVGASNPENLKCASPERTAAVLNTSLVPTIDVIRTRVLAGPERMMEQIRRATDAGKTLYVDANRLAEALFGSHLAVNLFLLGVAWQGGLVPVSLTALRQAIELNGVEVERNLEVFDWGRKYYVDPEFVEQQIQDKPMAHREERQDPVEVREAELRAYQNAAWALEYRRFVDEVALRAPALREPVARSLFKLMAYKDEYEVARLLTSPEFESQVREQWQAVESIRYNLHPPFLRRFGMTRKLKLGPWFRPLLLLLAKGKALRGTPFDIFAWSAHRRMERSLISWYRDLMRQAMDRMDGGNQAVAMEIASLPELIRGYEGIKELSVAAAKAKAEALLRQMSESRQEQPV